MGRLAALSVDLDAVSGGAAGGVLLAEGTAGAKARGEHGTGEGIREKQGDTVRGPTPQPPGHQSQTCANKHAREPLRQATPLPALKGS